MNRSIFEANNLKPGDRIQLALIHGTQTVGRIGEIKSIDADSITLKPFVKLPEEKYQVVLNEVIEPYEQMLEIIIMKRQGTNGEETGH